jgi:hypothetical protein
MLRSFQNYGLAPARKDLIFRSKACSQQLGKSAGANFRREVEPRLPTARVLENQVHHKDVA